LLCLSKPLERLTIENFAGIKQLDLEIRPFTVLIGPQSVGKSITAKLLYFFKSVPLALLRAANSETQSSPEDVALKLFGDLLPTPTHAGGSSTVTYSIGNSKICLKHTGEHRAQ
jgi:AAA ATPase domain